jgi:RNA polymerase sigma-70 factor (ECF subfamily)
MKNSKPSLNPEEIIIAFKSQNWIILEELIKQYTGILLKGALSLGFKGTQADDLVQSTWSTFFEALERFEGKSQLKTFLYGILINKSRELRKENIKHENHDSIEEIMESRFNANGSWAKPPMSPEELLQTTQTLKLIHSCIDKLPTTQRAAFCLWELEEEETAEICKIMNVSVTNLGVILYRAKNKLRECIEFKAKGIR